MVARGQRSALPCGIAWFLLSLLCCGRHYRHRQRVNKRLESSGVDRIAVIDRVDCMANCPIEVVQQAIMVCRYRLAGDRQALEQRFPGIGERNQLLQLHAGSIALQGVERPGGA